MNRSDDAPGEKTERQYGLSRRLVAEAMGTAGLLIAIVGSGIMGEELAGGNIAVALLANSLATGLALAVIIIVFLEVSGAHLNPVVTLSEVLRGGMPWTEAASYVVVQIGGALAGVALADLIFGMPAFSVSEQVRAGYGLVLSEVLATFGLVFVILVCAARQRAALPFAVGGYIAAAYWFTSSTSFANPAVTLGRMVTNTFTGIRPVDAPPFIGAQIVGAVAATVVFQWLIGKAWTRE